MSSFRRRKIAWIVPGYQSDERDRCIPALTDLAHAVAERHELKVYALQYPGREDSYRVGKVAVRSFKPGPPARVPKLARAGTLARAVNAIRRDSPDLLHAFWAAEPAGVGVAASKLLRRPLVVACMGGEAVNLPEIGYGAGRRRLDRFYLKLAVSGAKVLTAGSETLASMLRALYGGRVNIRLMPLGVDTERFRPCYKELPDRPLILAVGSLLPVKGHTQLVRAMAYLPEMRLRIVGEGPERGNLERLIATLKLEEQVELAGEVEPDSMPGEYNSADLLALPSYYESQCMALLEGLACGLPAVAAPVGIAPEVLGDGKAGELSPDNSPAGLADAVKHLLARPQDLPEYWPQMQREARAVSEKYSLEECTRRLLELYDACIV